MAGRGDLRCCGRELGQGYSGFVVAAGRAFTQFQTRTGQFVIALDPDTGSELWRRRVGWAWQPAGAYPGPFATPTCRDGRVYYATPAGVVGCLAAADGREAWSVDVQAKFAGRGTEFGYASTPLVEDGKVILPVGGADAGVVALDAADGSTVWAAGGDPASYCPALPITLGGRRLVFAFLRNSLAAHDLGTGRVVWRQTLSREYDEHAAWPLFAEPDVLVSAPFRAGSRLIRLAPDGDRVTGKEQWSGRALSLDVCSAVRVGSAVYGFDIHQLQASTRRPSRGAFKCLDLATGAARWEAEDVGQATAVAADGKLLLLDESGNLILAAADAAAYRELGRARVFDGREMGWTPPALSGGRLFLRSHARAACLYVGLPSDLNPDRPRAALPPVRGGFDWGRLFVREPEFPNDAPTAHEVASWFAWCVVGVFGGAFVAAAAAAAAARAVRAERPPAWFGRVFLVAALMLGMGGTTAIGAWADAFALTWPAALYAAFRATAAAGARARGVEGRPPDGAGSPVALPPRLLRVLPTLPGRGLRPGVELFGRPCRGPSLRRRGGAGERPARAGGGGRARLHHVLLGIRPAAGVGGVSGKIGPSAIAAGPVGRQAEAGTDGRLQAEPAISWRAGRLLAFGNGGGYHRSRVVNPPPDRSTRCTASPPC